MKERWHSYYWLFMITAIVVALDQITKAWVHLNLPVGEVYHPESWLSGYARIVHAKNTGAVLGMFQDLGDVFTIFTFLVGASILYYYPRLPSQDWLIRLAMSLYLGGAIGNLIDRLAYGYVTDLISVGSLPIINLADICLSLGVLLFIFMILSREKVGQPSKKSGL